MAFTQAKQVAELVKRHVLPGVVVSVGKAQGAPLEVVIRGFRHPEDGLSRLWLIDLIGQSGVMLDMVIIGLRKAGFEMSGAAPLMRGVLTQMLTRVEIAKMRAREREVEKKKEKAEFKAELQAETLIAQQDVSKEIEGIRDEITGLREMFDDIALMPAPRGKQGPAGRDGVDGKDGSVVELSEAKLSDLGDVLDAVPEERQVLTYKDNKWQPLYVPTLSGNIYPGGGSGEGGTGTPFEGFTVSERSYNFGDPVSSAGPAQNTITGITKLSFNTESGFRLTDLGNNEALLNMNSSFNPWSVTGEDTLDATGEEPIEFVAGSGMTIRTDTTTTPQQIIFESSGGGGGGGAVEIDDLNDVDTETNPPAIGQVLVWNGSNWVPGGTGTGGGIAEAPVDNLPYVRINAQWVKLADALQLLIDGSNLTTGQTDASRNVHMDGGDFNTGDTESNQLLDAEMLDGGDFS